MSLRTKISAALCLAFLAALAGLAPAFLALLRVEQAFVDAYLADPESVIATGDTAARLHEQIRFGLLSMAPGALGLFFVLLALALLARRIIVLPLRTVTATLGRVGSGDFTAPPTLARQDEIGELSRAVGHMAAELNQVLKDASTGRSAVADSEARFRDFATAASDWLWETDAKGRITYFSGRIEDMTSQATQDIIGTPLNVLMSVRGARDTTRDLELDSRRAIRDLVCTYKTRDGDARYCRLSGTAVSDEADVFQGYRGVATDITDEVKAEEAAEALAFHDPLTGLANRRLLEDRIAQALTARAVTKGGVAVLHLDLDRFKAVNDAFGFDTGDAVLQEVGARLTALAGPQDTVGRPNGDEFVIVQGVGAQPEAAEHLCLAVLSALREPLKIGDQCFELTASLGCAIAAADETNGINLLRNADVAMYRAKDDGRDTYRFHETAMTTALKARMTMERDLRAAISADALEVHYQPLMSATTHGISGFEAMVRWPRAGHGMVYPRDFLPLAEDTGLIVPLGENILNTACRTAMSWPDLHIAVNLSQVHFLHESLLRTVVRVLRESCLSAHLLELEITESALLTAEDTAIFQFDALREMGVRLVMDKFGSGTSSLQHLRRFRFNKLKLDRSFVAGIEQDADAAEITRSVLQLAAALGMETAADGITSEKQAGVLIAQGCQQLQGKLFGKALTAERAFQLLRTHGIMPGAPKAERHL